jgi:transposase
MNNLYEIIKAYYSGGIHEIVRRRVNLVLPLLNERQRRLYLACEAQAIGAGGIAALSRMSGVSTDTIAKGLKELAAGSPAPDARRSRKTPERKSGKKRRYPDILDDIKAVMENQEGQAENILRYTTKSAAAISAALKEGGIEVSTTYVCALLKRDGYNLRKAVKKEGAGKGPGAWAQFVYINKKAKAYIKRGEPVFAIEAKELGRRKDLPGLAYDHDYLEGELGKPLPSARSALFQRAGFVNAGLGDNTARIAIDRLGHWWEAGYFERRPNTGRMLIIADFCQSSDWIAMLRALADRIDKKITVLHFPPGITKWDRIEHRFYTFVGGGGERPLINRAVIFNLMGAGPDTGLSLECVTDTGKEYKPSKKKGAYPMVLISRGEWDHTIFPTKKDNPGKRAPGAGLEPAGFSGRRR